MNSHETLDVVRSVKLVFMSERITLSYLSGDYVGNVKPIAKILFSNLRNIFPELRERVEYPKPTVRELSKPRLVKKG